MCVSLQLQSYTSTHDNIIECDVVNYLYAASYILAVQYVTGPAIMEQAGTLFSPHFQINCIITNNDVFKPLH